MISDLEIKENEVVKKALGILGKNLTVERYARFLAAITPKIGDSVKELREFRDAKTGGGQMLSHSCGSRLQLLAELGYELWRHLWVGFSEFKSVHMNDYITK